MTFPELNGADILRLASLDGSSYVVDYLSVHRDIALAMVVRRDSNGSEEFLVSARCDEGVWSQVDTIGDRDTVDAQFGGGSRGTAGRELTYRIPGVVTLRTVISPLGNWAFVYSDPEGRKVMGMSVVEGDLRPPVTGR